MVNDDWKNEREPLSFGLLRENRLPYAYYVDEKPKRHERIRLRAMFE
jgi:hypothetical protein